MFNTQRLRLSLGYQELSISCHVQKMMNCNENEIITNYFLNSHESNAIEVNTVVACFRSKIECDV